MHDIASNKQVHVHAHRIFTIPTLSGVTSFSIEVNYHDYLQDDSNSYHMQNCKLSGAPFDEVAINFHEVVLQF